MDSTPRAKFIDLHHDLGPWPLTFIGYKNKNVKNFSHCAISKIQPPFNQVSPNASKSLDELPSIWPWTLIFDLDLFRISSMPRTHWYHTWPCLSTLTFDPVIPPQLTPLPRVGCHWVFSLGYSLEYAESDSVVTPIYSNRKWPSEVIYAILGDEAFRFRSHTGKHKKWVIFLFLIRCH